MNSLKHECENTIMNGKVNRNEIIEGKCGWHYFQQEESITLTLPQSPCYHNYMGRLPHQPITCIQRLVLISQRGYMIYLTHGGKEMIPKVKTQQWNIYFPKAPLPQPLLLQWNHNTSHAFYINLGSFYIIFKYQDLHILSSPQKS